MTEQSSCKSFFGAYLRYRIKSQRMNLILSCILNLLTLPLFVLGYISGQKDEYSQFYYFGTFFPILCGAFLIVLAVIGAMMSFEVYYKKNLTDTAGSLPLTYRQRFWGDFLAGYIANVTPAIPFGLVTAVIAGTYSAPEELVDGWDITMSQFIPGMTFALFFTLTFVYLFAVLVTSACGKILHSVLFTVFGIAAFCGTFAGLGGCFGIGMLGVDPSEYMDKAASFFPPLGTFIDLFHGVRFMSGGTLEMWGGGWWNPYGSGILFPTMSVSHIVWFVILGAGITLGAYYVGKYRKTEKIGSAFTVKPVFYVISALSCAAGVFIMYVSNAKDRSSDLGMGMLFAIGVGAVACAVSIVMYLPKKKILPQCIFCGMVAVIASAGVAALLRGTGSFGAAYLPENTKEIEYIRVNYDYYITDKSEIKQYINNFNDILQKAHGTLTCGDRYVIEYKTTDGKITQRRYLDRDSNATQLMYDSERKLPGYGRYFFETVFSHRSNNSGCRIIKGGDTYEIPEQSCEEFVETLSREAAEKYDPDAETYAKLEFLAWGSSMPFYIGENLEDTIAFLENIKDTSESEPDLNEIVWKIDYRPEGTDNGSLKVNIRNRDMDDPLVKELIGLLKDEYNAAPLDQDFMAYYSSSVSDTGWTYYYVSQENSKRVLELMTELVIRELEA